MHACVIIGNQKNWNVLKNIIQIARTATTTTTAAFQKHQCQCKLFQFQILPPSS